MGFEQIVYGMVGAIAIVLALTFCIPLFNAVMVSTKPAIQATSPSTAGAAISLLGLWPLLIVAVLVTGIILLCTRQQPRTYGGYGGWQ